MTQFVIRKAYGRTLQQDDPAPLPLSRWDEEEGAWSVGLGDCPLFDLMMLQEQCGGVLVMNTDKDPPELEIEEDETW